MTPTVTGRDRPTTDISTPTAALPTELPVATPVEDQASNSGIGLSISESVPSDIVTNLQNMAMQNPDRFQFQLNPQDSESMVEIGLGGSLPMAEWTYALSAPFATAADSISAEED